MKTQLMKFRPLFAIVFLIVLFAVIGPSQFMSVYNFKTILTQAVIISLAALGITFVIASGGIDLSIGSQVALVTVGVATGVRWLAGGDANLPVGVGATIGIAVGWILVCVLVGVFLGWITTRFAVSAFIASLGLMQVLRGLAKLISHETTVTAPETFLAKFMEVDPEPSWLLLAPGIWITLLGSVVAVFLLHRTAFGRWTYAVGSNERAAFLSGISIQRQRIFIYALAGVFTAIAGILQFANLTVGDPTAAIGFELDVIAAVVLGGASLFGGTGSIAGSLAGALVMAILRNGCNMVGIATYAQEIFVGLIIIAVVAVDQALRKNKLR